MEKVFPHHTYIWFFSHHSPNPSTVRPLFHHLPPLHIRQWFFFFCLQEVFETLLAQVGRVCFITFMNHHRSQLQVAERLLAALIVATKQRLLRNAYRARYENPLFHFFFLILGLDWAMCHPRRHAPTQIMLPTAGVRLEFGAPNFWLLLFFFLLCEVLQCLHSSKKTKDGTITSWRPRWCECDHSKKLSGSCCLRVRCVGHVTFHRSALVCSVRCRAAAKVINEHSTMPKPFPHFSKKILAPCSIFASSFSFWYLHKPCSLLTNCKAFLRFSVFHFLYFFNDLVLQSFICSALYFELAFSRILKIFLSFVQHLSFLTCVLPSSFQLRQTFQLRIPPGTAGNT